MKKRYLALILLLLAVPVILYGFWENKQLSIGHYQIAGLLEDIRIAHVSDLHNAEIGENNNTLVQAIAEAKPDLIFLTGDMIDGRHSKLKLCLDFIEQIKDIAPIYYVTGNHEAYVPHNYETLQMKMEAMGVQVIDYKKQAIQLKGQDFVIYGVGDSRFFGSGIRKAQAISIIQEALQNLEIDHNLPSLLLSHRPERFKQYVEAGLDVVFTGHAHGGQLRLPIAFFAPGQGLFPAYTSGVIQEGKTHMVVSRGLGNSRFPFRLNNKPELVIVDFVKELP